MQDIIQDSWGYQEIMQEGFEKGIEKGIEKGKFEESRRFLECLVQKRFPALIALVKQDAGQISSLEALHAATDELFEAESTEDARQIIEFALQQGQKRD